MYSQRGEVRQLRERARVHVRQWVGAQLEAREAAARLQHARLHHLHAVARQRPGDTCHMLAHFISIYLCAETAYKNTK